MPLPEHRVACLHLTSMRARQRHTHPQVPPVKSAGKKLSVRPASFLSGTEAHHFPRFAQTFPNKDICGRVPAVPKRRFYAEKRLDYTRSRTHRAARGGKTPRPRGGRPLRHGARDRLRGNRRHRKRRAPLPRRRRDGHGEHRHGFCPHGSNDEKDGEHGRAPHGREDAVTLPCGIADLVIDRLTPEVIAVYERRIAGAPLLSEKSEAELSLAASELKLSVKKYEALVLLADLMARTSKPVPLSLLASLGDGELLRLARKHAKLYAASLTEEERDSLKDEFKAALKK